MDDREGVTAIVAGDPAGLAYAYDRYAPSLYGYCAALLHSPDDAADALQDTFVVTAARVGELRDPYHLRPWLYAVARNECQQRLRSRPRDARVPAEDFADAEPGPAAEPGLPAEPGLSAQQAELRELVRTAMTGLDPADREIIDLSLRQELGGTELAVVLGVSRNQAHAMASRARGHLEAALGVLLVARTGRRSCAELGDILGDWDGRLATVASRRVSRHIGSCEICNERRQRALRPALQYGIAPLAALPVWLRHQTLQLCSDPAPDAREFKRHVLRDAGAFDADGFPRAVRQGRRFEPGPALITVASFAAAGIVVLLLLALRGSPAAIHPVDSKSTAGAGTVAVASSSAGSPTPLVPVPTGTPSSAAGGNGGGSAEPSSSAPASAPPATSASPSKSPSPSASKSPSPSPSPSPSSSPSPTPEHIPTRPPTPSPTPTTTTASPTNTTTTPPTVADPGLAPVYA